MVELARQHQAEKRGDGARNLSLNEAVSFYTERDINLVALDDALKMLETLDPQNNQVRRNPSVSLNGMGGILLQGGDAMGALEHHRRALSTAEAMSASDQASAENRKDISFTLYLAAEAHAARRDFRAAAENYRRAIAIQEPALEAAPANERLRADLASNFAGLGRALAEMGDVSGSIDAAQRAVPLAERALECHFSTQSYRRLLCAGSRACGAGESNTRN